MISSLSICTRTRRTCARWRRTCCSYTRASRRTPSLSWWETPIAVVGRHACVWRDPSHVVFYFWRKLWPSCRTSPDPSPPTAASCRRSCPTSSRGVPSRHADALVLMGMSEPDVWPQLWQSHSVSPLKYSQKMVLLIYELHSNKYIYDLIICHMSIHMSP